MHEANLIASGNLIDQYSLSLRLTLLFSFKLSTAIFIVELHQGCDLKNFFSFKFLCSIFFFFALTNRAICLKTFVSIVVPRYYGRLNRRVVMRSPVIYWITEL